MKDKAINNRETDNLDSQLISNRPECLIKIESIYRSLNKAERKVAKYILTDASKILHMTISEMAAQTQVSESTIFKFCRTLGFKGFRAFRVALARQEIEPKPKIFTPVKKSDDAKNVAFKVFTISIQTLQDTLSVMDFEEMERAYDAIKKARKVLVIALSVSRTTAIFAADKLSFVGIDTRAVTDAHFQMMHAAQLTDKDVLLAFSRSGDTRDIIEASKMAKKMGATVISISNNSRSYFAKTADIVLTAKSIDTRYSDDLLASRIEHISIIDVLYTMLASRNIKKASLRHKRMHDAALTKQY
ncbi:MAG: MurR/RpiR family transcriptional regulator [Desulfobacterales bacterium]|nr:MurR/RpiR family transcriptional regulator [Desulfobacterales bacterium]